MPSPVSIFVTDVKPDGLKEFGKMVETVAKPVAPIIFWVTMLAWIVPAGLAFIRG
jgi:hypothetical protein